MVDIEVENVRLKAERDELLASVDALVSTFQGGVVYCPECSRFHSESCKTSIILSDLPSAAKDHIELHDALLKEHDALWKLDYSTGFSGTCKVDEKDFASMMEISESVEAIKQRVDKT